MPAPAAPENGPAPTPARAVYGFLLFVVSVLAAVIYLTWVLVPPDWLKTVGLDYWPQRLWALTVPTTVLIALFLFVLVIYPLLGLVDAPGLSDTRIYTDEFSLPEQPVVQGGIPAVSDISLSEVCRHLYLADSEDDVWGEGRSPEVSPRRNVETRTRETRTGETRGDRPRRRQSERRWERETARDIGRDGLQRIGSWGGRDSGPDYGDLRWRSRGDSWRVRRRLGEDSDDGLSPDPDSPNVDS